MQTSVQDWPGRTKLWHVGVPPSGPMDSLSHRSVLFALWYFTTPWQEPVHTQCCCKLCRVANALVGNDEDAAALEFSLTGPTLKFHTDCLVALTGVEFAATLDGQEVGVASVLCCCFCCQFFGTKACVWNV